MSARPLRVGRVAGHRGGGGELTVRVASGDAAPWSGLPRVWLARESAPGTGTEYEVERARAYRDRLVLKLRDVDDPARAAGLKGRVVWAARADLPPLPEGAYQAERLVGLGVVDEEGRELGRVGGLIRTGGSDLLSVETPAGDEMLIPLVPAIVPSVDEVGGTLTARLPEGLEELNRGSGADR